MRRIRTTAGLFTAAMIATVASQAPADAGARAKPVSCYGYTTPSIGSFLLETRWDDGSEECFTISPTRRILHTWPNSGGWYEMPGNGRADDVVNAWETNGDRTVEVDVVGSSSNWCNTNPVGSASWGSWRRC